MRSRVRASEATPRIIQRSGLFGGRPIDNARNLEARGQLVNLLRTGLPIGVTGAGVSVWAGLLVSQNRLVVSPGMAEDQ